MQKQGKHMQKIKKIQFFWINNKRQKIKYFKMK
jgi:hypothetical protein